jgi:glutaredoxin 2
VNEGLIWTAIVGAIGSIVAVAKFWMDLGKSHQIAEEAKKQAGDAKDQATALNAKLDLLTSNINEYKVSAAQTYATNAALKEAEQSLARSLENTSQGIYQRLDNMTTRLDSLITIANNREHH